MEREQVHQAIATVCRVLRVSGSGFSAGRKRPLSARATRDAPLTEQIVTLHQASRESYGAPRSQADLVVSALDMALWNRRPERGVIHPSDHGRQDTSIAFGQRCQEAGVPPSMGSVAECFENAITESWFATLECALLDRSPFRTHAEARTAIFASMEGFSNTHRRHSALGYVSPADFARPVPQETAA